MEKYIEQLSNDELKSAITNILMLQQQEESVNMKIQIDKEIDYDLEDNLIYVITVEDESYFYANEDDRDNDYRILCKILSNSSKKFFY